MRMRIEMTCAYSEGSSGGRYGGERGQCRELSHTTLFFCVSVVVTQ